MQSVNQTLRTPEEEIRSARNGPRRVFMPDMNHYITYFPEQHTMP